MEIIVSNTGGCPIYEQIYQQIKMHILKDRIKEGDALPSMRLLAKELRISVITTKRAYEELERDGYIISVVGKGSFVAGKNTELIREENLKKIEQLLGEATELARLCVVPIEELEEILRILYQEEAQ